MGLTRQEAFEILGVTRGSSEDDIRSAYKKLALQWHPDKHSNSDEATKKFQDISAAYKRLTSSDDFSEIIVTPEDMFDLFAQMFFGQRSFRTNHHYFFDNSSDDEMDDDSDDCDDFDFGINEDYKKTYNYPFPPSNSSSKKSKPTVYSYTARRPTASEASKNAEELMKEEERQRKQREKKKAKKKRQKENKRLEKEKKEQEEEEKKKKLLEEAAAKQRKLEEELRAKMAAEAAAETSDDDEEEEVKEEEADKENIHHTNKIDPKKATKNPNSKSTSSNNIKVGKDTKHGRPNAAGDKNSSSGGSSVKSTPKSTPTKKSNKKQTINHQVSTSSDSYSDQEETTGLDPTSAFFVRAAASANKKINSHPQPKPKKEEKVKKINGKKRAEDADSVEELDPVILRSRQIAVKGNEMANLGHYTAAIELFSQAIQLNPRDFRFFGNRSFCYDRLDMYDKALKDAEKAISLAKNWPKGYFRKGRALSGLRLYSEAENAFEQVLKLDKNCEEAVEELRRVRGYQLMEMGFTRPQSEAAIRQYGTVQAALEVLLVQGAPSEISSQAFGEDVYLSDEEDYITETIEQSKLDAGNPEGLRSLWIGNVQPTVSDQELKDVFGQFGEIHSLRRLNDKFCSFINFKKASQASTAMARLQGQELHGRFLLIKFPDNPIIEGQPRTTILKKNQDQQRQQQQQQQQQHNQSHSQEQSLKLTAQQKKQMQDSSKMSGPVNGDECYFWRTTGCAFGDRCKYKHIGSSKGLDRQAWQKTLYKN